MSTSCYARRCPNPAIGIDTVWKRPACETHMSKESLAAAPEKPNLGDFEKLLARLRPLQQRLFCERQELEAAFDAAMDALEAGKRRLIDQTEAELDRLHEGLRACDQAKKLAASTVDVVRLSGQLPRLKELAEAKAQPGLAIANLGPRSQALAFILDAEVEKILGRDAPWSLRASLGNLEAEPALLAVCCQTDGFSADQQGRVVKAAAAAPGGATARIAAPCAVVAFRLGSPAQQRLCLVTPVHLDGEQQKQQQPRYLSIQLAGLSWTNGGGVSALHCDSRVPAQQRLYIAQSDVPDLVTITDLAGTPLARLTPQSLGCPIGKVSGLSGTCDKLLVYCCERDCRLLAVGKDASASLHGEVAMPDMRRGSPESVAACGHCFLVTDATSGGCDVWCLVSGTRLDRLPPTHNAKRLSGQLAVDSRSLVYACNLEGGQVHVLHPDGRHLHSVGGGGALKSPVAVAVVEAEAAAVEDIPGATTKRQQQQQQQRLLLVADGDNKRIQVFNLP